jgi:hypothetical protein
MHLPRSKLLDRFGFWKVTGDAEEEITKGAICHGGLTCDTQTFAYRDILSRPG